MKRIKANYQTLHGLKTSQTKLRTGIISNCDSDIVTCIGECSLNVLNRNIALTDCDKRKLHKHESVQKQFPLSDKKQLIVQRRGFLLPLLNAVLPTLASFIAAKQQ
jgi:hypothetical protein